MKFENYANKSDLETFVLKYIIPNVNVKETGIKKIDGGYRLIYRGSGLGFITSYPDKGESDKGDSLSSKTAKQLYKSISDAMGDVSHKSFGEIL
jgi:hypothetical protein